MQRRSGDLLGGVLLKVGVCYFFGAWNLKFGFFIIVLSMDLICPIAA
jgi:hypothetical protein